MEGALDTSKASEAVLQLTQSLNTDLVLPETSCTTKDFKNLERILTAAQQQQLRQLRRLQQLKKQTELAAAQQATWEAKEREEQLRKELKQAEAAEESARKATKAAEAEARRKAAQQAAEAQEEENRKRLEEKLAKTRPRLNAAVVEYERRVSAAKSAARLQRTLARKEQVLEEKRAAVLAAEQAAERRVQQKQELRLLQEAIKREQDSLAEEHRRLIQAKAEADEAAKVAYYKAKNKAREQRVEQRQQENEVLRTLRAEESRLKFAYIRSRALAVEEHQQAKTEELQKRLQDKFGRVEALAAERQALQQQLKKTLEVQDLQIKQVCDKLAATGKLVLPPELLATLTALESAVISPYSPRSASSSPAPGRSALSSPKAKLGPSGAVALSSPHRLVDSCEIVSPPGMLPAAAIHLQRQQEAALQRVLEEEILKEMARENTLQQVSDAEERKHLIKQFTAERETAKGRILEVGNKLITQTSPCTMENGPGASSNEPTAGVVQSGLEPTSSRALPPKTQWQDT